MSDGVMFVLALAVCIFTTMAISSASMASSLDEYPEDDEEGKET